MDSGAAPAGVIVVSDRPLGQGLVRALQARGFEASACADVEALARRWPLEGVSAVVLDLDRLGRGAILLLAARLALHLPWVQKLALVEQSLPLVTVAYLGACSVELLDAASIGMSPILEIETLTAFVGRACDRRSWCLAG